MHYRMTINRACADGRRIMFTREDGVFTISASGPPEHTVIGGSGSFDVGDWQAVHA